MIFVAGIEGTFATSRAIRMNEWLPIRTGASGLSILAFLERNEQQAVIERSGLHDPSAGIGAHPDRLQTNLADIRGQGYAYTRCHLVSGAVGLAAPIFSRCGDVMGSVCVTMPAQRAGQDSQTQLVDAVRHCASDITASMQSEAIAIS